jgi:hypothetical protein
VCEKGERASDGEAPVNTVLNFNGDLNGVL